MDVHILRISVFRPRCCVVRSFHPPIPLTYIAASVVTANKQPRSKWGSMAATACPSFLWTADAAGVTRSVVGSICSITRVWGNSTQPDSEGGERDARIHKAAKVLQTTVEDVEKAVAVLTALLAHAVRCHLERSQLLVLLADAGLQDPASQVLCDLFEERQPELRGVVALTVHSYHHIDWRLDIQVASRSVRQQARPVYIVALASSAGVVHLEADYGVLKEVCAQLEVALAESRSTQSRRIQRLLK